MGYANRMKFTLLLLTQLFVFSCAVEAEDFEFGHDACHFCKMNIVDSEHAAQLVTTKGKQKKFDAIECLVNSIADDANEPAIILVSDYGHHRRVDAKSATYLASKKLRSPMGANLSAFSTKEKAEAAQKEYGGKIYSWEQVRTRKWRVVP